MKCPSEFILSQYVDGELAIGEAGELAEHIRTCTVCRELVMEL